MRVHCDATNCTFNREYECQRAEINLDDTECLDYEDYVDNSPLYQNEFFKRCRKEVDGKIINFRAQGKGLRYEWSGLVLYTQSDIRYSLDNVEFTEEISGMRLSAHDMKKDGIVNIIQKYISELPPLMELPWMECNRYTGKLVPPEKKDDMLPDDFEIKLA